MKQKNERRLPDEIFALIIEWLDDQTSLQNTALVCKDFTFFSQQCFFKEIDFGDNSYMTEGRFPWISRFVALLRDPHSGFLGNFVQKLDFWGYPVGREPEDLEADMKFILQALPFLTKLMIESPSFQLFRAIGMFLGGKLEELWLDGVYLGGLDEFRIFQGMLTSLTALKSLSIRHCTGLKDQVLALPTSLRAASFALTDESILHAIGLGMEAPSQISTLFLDFDTGISNYSILWRVLGLDTVVVLDVGTARQHTFVPAMDIFAQGLRVRRLIITCFQMTSVAAFFVQFIPSLSNSVREICIDFVATHMHSSPARKLKHWIELDAVLMRRYELGLLERIQFRCTRRIDVLGYHAKYGFQLTADFDRTILALIDSLLPRSQRIGLIEVNDRMFFEPVL